MWQYNLWSRCLNWRFLLLGLHDYLPFFLIKPYTDVFLSHFLVLSFHLHHCTGFAFRTLSLFRCLAKLRFTPNEILFPSGLGSIYYSRGGQYTYKYSLHASSLVYRYFVFPYNIFLCVCFVNTLTFHSNFSIRSPHQICLFLNIFLYASKFAISSLVS